MSVSVALSPIPVLQFLDNTGRPAVGGSLTTQVGGVNYPAYSDNTGNTPLPNPIPLNSRGEVSTAAGATAELFLQQGVSYTLILKDSAGNQLWSVSNVVAALSGQSVSLPAVSGTANAIILTNANPITVVAGTIQWFIPTAANSGATTINVDNNGAVSVRYLTKALVSGEIQIGVPTQIISDGTVWNLAWSAKGPAADYYVDSGSVNAIVVTINTVPATATALAGTRIKVKVANTTTSTNPTITVNGVSYGIILNDHATLAPPGSIIGGVADCIYDFILGPNASNATLMNPSRVTGSFTATLATGLTTTPTGTVNYAIDQSGKEATVWANAQVSGTSNATGMTITGPPAILSAANNHVGTPGFFADSSANLIGVINNTNTTTWQCLSGATLSSTGFTASGTKGLRIGWMCKYNLD